MAVAQVEFAPRKTPPAVVQSFGVTPLRQLPLERQHAPVGHEVPLHVVPLPRNTPCAWVQSLGLRLRQLPLLKQQAPGGAQLTDSQVARISQSPLGRQNDGYDEKVHQPAGHPSGQLMALSQLRPACAKPSWSTARNAFVLGDGGTHGFGWLL